MATDPADAPKVVAVGEGIHVWQAVDNMAWVNMGEYALVVDALEQPQLEGQVFDAIQSTLGDIPISYLLNTHTHGDHTALNGAFQRRFGTQIINQRTSPLPPEGRWFEGSRRRALMLPIPGCHTQEDCAVWVPDDKTLFVGDVFGWGLIACESGLDVRAAKLLVDTYVRLIEFDAAIVIPGHGPLCTTAELQRWLDYFQWLRAQVVQACGRGQTDEEIARTIAPPEDMKTWWRFLQWKHDDSLRSVLQAVRSGRLGNGEPSR